MCSSDLLEFGAWETSDCKEVIIDPANDVRSCKCKHLAHFGLLFVSHNQRLICISKLMIFTPMFCKDLSPKPVTGDAAVALSVITYVGLIISLLCLTLFIVTYLCEKYGIYIPLKLPGVMLLIDISIQEVAYKHSWSDSGQHELSPDWSLRLFPD